MSPLHLPHALPSLLTPRLLLRALDAGDSAELFAIYGDSEVMRFVGEPPFPSLATVAQMLTALIAYARQLGIATLVADIEPDNLPSQRLFRRLGFVWQQATCYRLSLEGITPDHG